MGGDFYPYGLIPAGHRGHHTLFIGGVARQGLYGLQALLPHQTFDQRWPELGVDGIGTLNAQRGRIVSRHRQQGSRDAGKSGACKEQRRKQSAQHRRHLE